jgi:hypothetical protein
VRRKRAFIYLAACVLCATVAAIVAMKFISKASANSQPTDRINLLLATQDIKQGEVIALANAGGKGNVTFVGWPHNLVPAGGITDKKALSDSPLRARTSFVKNEPIQTSRVVKAEDYVPADMYPQIVKVDVDDLKNGRLRLGMKVDVLLVTNKQPMDFMHCGQIYAIGRLDDKGLPVIEKDPPPNVWLLVKKTDRDAFVAAEYGSGKLVVVEASDPQCTAPYLAEQPDSAQARKKDADDMLTRAKALEQAGQYEQALSVLDDLVNNYADVTSVASQATVEQSKAKESMAQSLYQRAQTALDHDKNYTEALRLLDEVDAQAAATSPLRQKSAALRQRAQAALETSRQKAQFEALTAAIDDALASGDLPKAQDKQAELEQFSQKGLEFPDVKKQPKEAADDYAKLVKSALTDFSIKKQALQFFLKRDDLQSAQEQLTELKKKYPAHPDVPELEKAVLAAQKPAQ